MSAVRSDNDISRPNQIRVLTEPLVNHREQIRLCSFDERTQLLAVLLFPLLQGDGPLTRSGATNSIAHRAPSRRDRKSHHPPVDDVDRAPDELIRYQGS